MQNLIEKINTEEGKMKVLYPAGFLDVKQWLTPYLAKMFDVTTANCFRFRMLNNQVIYESRPNSQVPVWTEVGSLLKSIPRGNPKTVKIDNSPLKKFSKKIDSFGLSIAQVLKIVANKIQTKI